MPYLGRSPGTGVRSRYIYTATASQTAFSGADDNGATLSYMDGTYVDVYMNGVLLKPVTDYAATTKTSIVLTANAAASDLVEIITYDIASIADTVSKANGGTFDANLTIAGNATISDDLTVDTSTLVVDSTNNRVGVGNAAPSATLDVNGTIKLDGNYPTGTDNVALGNVALDDPALSGNQNVAIGSSALTGNSSGTGNIGIGASAAGSNTTGSSSTAVGNAALLLNTTASFNTSVGAVSGYNSTGGYNTFLGYGAGYHVSSGTKNTIIGLYNGNQAGLDIRTANNHIVLSDGDGNPRVWVDAGGGFIWSKQPTTSAAGIELTNTTHPYIRISGGSDTANRYRMEFINGNGTVGTITTSGSSTAYNTSSDYRLKENVVELTGATDRLKQLNPSRFNFIADPDTTVDGFLAHEVQSVVPEAITGTHDAVDADGNPVYQGIDQSKLVPLLTAALQEAVAKIETLETANADMLARIEALENA